MNASLEAVEYFKSFEKLQSLTVKALEHTVHKSYILFKYIDYSGKIVYVH